MSAGCVACVLSCDIFATGVVDMARMARRGATLRGLEAEKRRWGARVDNLRNILGVVVRMREGGGGEVKKKEVVAVVDRSGITEWMNNKVEHLRRMI